MRLILQLASLMLRGTALMLALVGAAFALACLGGVFSDRLDALTHFAPIWLAMGLGGLGLGLVSARDAERIAIAAIALVAVLACGALMTPELLAALGQPKPAPREARQIKLVQFNLWAGNDDPEATLKWILAQDADILTLEEGGGESWPVIEGLRRTYPYSVSCDGKRYCDTWIFSRKPMVKRRGFYQDRRRVAAATATLKDPDGNFTVVAAHYVWPLPAGRQQVQTRVMTQALKAFDSDSLIVAGDFNSTPWSFSLRRQDKAFGLERRTRALATWPTGAFSRLGTSPFPLLPIDHVYAGKAWKTVKVERGPRLGSDHRPVVVTLARAAP